MNSQANMPQGEPGTYLLWMVAGSALKLDVGRLGAVALPAGHYAYVGSAFGPGGIAARVRHHLRIKQRVHWHIDYLRRILAVDVVWYTHDPARREHDWAQALRDLGGSVEVPRFGASDCACASHLLAFARRPSRRAFAEHPCNRNSAAEIGRYRVITDADR